MGQIIIGNIRQLLGHKGRLEREQVERGEEMAVVWKYEGGKKEKDDTEWEEKQQQWRKKDKHR